MSQTPAWPVYAAQPPPPGERQYLLLRGGQRAAARLVWAVDEQGYRLSLMSEPAAGDASSALEGLGAASFGAIGPGGLMPERHVERRRGRDVRATNIDEKRGLVRGSGGGQAHHWPAGGQDRLSWLLQLAAVLSADPALPQAGGQVLLAVAGPRGPVAAWNFAVRGLETVALADGQEVMGLALTRAAQSPYDLQVDVWLDPAQHFMPLKLRLATPPGDWESLWLWQPVPP